MPTVSSSELPKPKSWDEFEDIAWDVYSRVWDDPNAQRNGRGGQRQHGVDIFGQPKNLKDRYAGIQCKRFEEGNLTRKKIDQEIAKAKKFQPPLAEYLIVTTEPRNANLQEYIRVINAKTMPRKKPVVRLFFWEDVCNLLSHPDNHDLLRKHYNDWQDVFAGSAREALVQLSVERDQLYLELSSAQERHIRDRWEELRATLNAGYREAIQEQIVALVDELESIVPTVQLSAELCGRVYRLAASNFLPNWAGGDAGRCRMYSAKAKGFSTGDGLIQCQIMEAFLAYQTVGSQAALDALTTVMHVEADRFRFSIWLDSENVGACAQLLQQISPADVLRTKDWLRLLAIYHAIIGDRPSLEDVLSQLTDNQAQANHYVMAGLALLRLAQKRLRQFCESTNTCMDFHIGLNLDELTDFDLQQRAAQMFYQAYQQYTGRACHVSALQSLLTAYQLEVDRPNSDWRDALKAELARNFPAEPIVALIVAESTTTTATLENLRNVLDNVSTNPHLTLDLALQLGKGAAFIQQVVELLQQYQLQFSISDSVFAHYLLVVFQLYQRADRAPDAIVDLMTLRPPQRYAHLWPLLQFILFRERNLERAVYWLNEALTTYAEHPEVLAVATQFFRHRPDRTRSLDCARKLFAMLRISETAEFLLQALFTNRSYPEYLTTASQIDDLHVDEYQLRAGRAYCYINLDQPLQAREHFEWLLEHDLAQLEDVLNLTRIYQYIGQPETALQILQTGVERFSDTPDAYLELSRDYLLAGQRIESYRWALLARNRFPDNAEVATHFLTTSFPTGFELLPEVGVTFREFLPGGRFASSGYIEAHPENDVIQLFQANRANAVQLEALYHQGKISAMMLCYVQNSPLFRLHHISTQLGLKYYTGAGDQDYTSAWLKQHSVSEVVLDYSAILTLWSLYHDHWLHELRRNFTKVWVSPKLLPILVWEQQNIVRQGQPARHRARTQIRDAIIRNAAKFQIHAARQTSPTEWDFTGSYTESAVAQELGLPYLAEFSGGAEAQPLSAIGLSLIAGILADCGEITFDTRSRLNANSHAVTEEETALLERLSRGSNLVVDMITLNQVVLCDAFQSFLAYFGIIHLSQPAWERLQSEIAEFDHQDQMAQDLRTLHRSLGEAITQGFVQLDSVLLDRRWKRSSPASTDSSPEEDLQPSNELEVLLIEYLDDLFGIAHFHQIPIWADDRWTSKFYPEDRKPPFVFGTDQFLEWSRTKHHNDDRYFDQYTQLIRWGYQGLPLNPDYVEWLLAQGVKPHAKSLVEALTSPRDFILDFWASHLAGADFSMEFGARLLTLYGRAIVDLLRHCFERKVDVATGAALFRILDLTLHAPQTMGREPAFLASLVLNVAEINQPDTANGVPQRVIPAFSNWFDEVMRTSGTSPELLEETWYGLLQFPIHEYESATSERDKNVAFLFAKRLMDIAPGYVRWDPLESTCRHASLSIL